jgi:hypothetical protein
VKATIAPAEIHMGREMAGVAGAATSIRQAAGGIMPTRSRRVKPPRMHICHVAALSFRAAGG